MRRSNAIFSALAVWFLGWAAIAQPAPGSPAANARAVSSAWAFKVPPLSLAGPSGTGSATTSWLYATRAFAPGAGDAADQNIIAIGRGTINAAVHLCSSVCGDEVAFGTNDLGADVSGHDNTAIGDDALPNLTTGANNSFVGSSAGANIRTGSNFAGLGASACQQVESGGPATCVGVSALQNAATSAHYATALGFQALFNAAKVANSVGLGDAAGYGAVSVSDATLVGVGACSEARTLSNVICIGRGRGPSGAIANALWIAGLSTATPIIFGDLGSGAVGINTSVLAPEAILTLGGGERIPAGYVLDWNGDVGFSRTSFDKLELGNGKSGDGSGALVVGNLEIAAGAEFTALSSGSVQLGLNDVGGYGGSLSLTNLTAKGQVLLNSQTVMSATAPTYSSGFSTSPPTITGTTTAAFTVTLGAPVSATGVLTMPSAGVAHGWVCFGGDQSRAAASVRETSSTPASVTFQLAAATGSDVLQFSCAGY